MPPDAGCVGFSCPQGGGVGGVGGGAGNTGGGAGNTGGGTGNTGGGTGNTGGGTGNTGGGTGNTGGGTGFGGWDGGTTISAVRGARFCQERVRLENVVVVGIDNIFTGGQGDTDTQFWVADQANVGNGIYVDKTFFDEPGNYTPVLGDVLNIDGYVTSESRFTNRIGRRVVFRSNSTCNRDGGLIDNANITVVSQGAMFSPVMVANGFGNADGGFGRPNPENAGGLVHIPGPLVLSDPRPEAMHRVSALGAADTRYFGFEVEGGVIVNNYKTFTNCDYRVMAEDGGTVTFNNGLIGIWDTYTHASCEDGGTSCPRDDDRRNEGIVPGTTNFYTYVLYPLDCAQIPAVVTP